MSNYSPLCFFAHLSGIILAMALNIEIIPKDFLYLHRNFF